VSRPFVHPSVRLKLLEQRARRRFGQNFLTEPDYCARIARAAGLQPGDRVLEVGPGLGILTDALLDAGAQVTCVELDRDLAAALRDSHPEVRLVEGDALRVDLADTCPGEGWKVAANLPYNVATPLLMRLLNEGPRFTRMALMFQREVADRICAEVDDDAWGALSVQVQVRAHVHRALVLPPGAFHPPPKVHSAVVAFTRVEQPDFGGVSARLFDRVVRLGFSLRRKKLVNALASGVPKERALEALAAAGIDPGVRAEVLTIPQWRALAGVFGQLDGVAEALA
jgi:16S rRNA (adenine1518-N6/adenine1519-N6)-dimethyltransferase